MHSFVPVDVRLLVHASFLHTPRSRDRYWCFGTDFRKKMGYTTVLVTRKHANDNSFLFLGHGGENTKHRFCAHLDVLRASTFPL